jgi:hypothetical protein
MVLLFPKMEVIKKTDDDGKEIKVASVYHFISASKIFHRVRCDKLANEFVLSVVDTGTPMY